MNVPPNAVYMFPSNKDIYPLLLQVQPHELQLRFSLLKLFNSFVSSALPLIDLTQVNQHFNSLAHRLSSIRPLIFLDIKISFLREVLAKTAADKEPPLIYLDRLE